MTLYNKLVAGESTEQPKPPIEENALLAQERINWLSSPATKLLFKSVGDEIAELIRQARALANEHSVNQNHLKIIQLI